MHCFSLKEIIVLTVIIKVSKSRHNSKQSFKSKIWPIRSHKKIKACFAINLPRFSLWTNMQIYTSVALIIGASPNEPSLVPGQIFATQKRNGTKRWKLGLVHTARVLVRMLIPYPRIWGFRNLLYIPATLYRILVRFVKNGRAIILENGVFRVLCCFPRLLLA